LSATAPVTNVCRIAEQHGNELGLADFEIDRAVHSTSEGSDEWLIPLRFTEVHPLLEDDPHGAIVVVDSATGQPRLIEGL